MAATTKSDYSQGFMYWTTEDLLPTSLPKLIDSLEPCASLSRVLKLVIQVTKQDSIYIEDTTAVAKLTELLRSYTSLLEQKGIRRVTAVLCKYGHFPKYFTFRQRLGYAEHMIYRQV